MRSYSLFIGIDISKNWIDACLTSTGSTMMSEELKRGGIPIKIRSNFLLQAKL